MNFINGDKYEGEWEDDKMNGKGNIYCYWYVHYTLTMVKNTMVD